MCMTQDKPLAEGARLRKKGESVIGGKYGSDGLVPRLRVHRLPVDGRALVCFRCTRGGRRQCSFRLLGVVM
jgi:hypothetical protein